ncbi:hypothetical protein M408DRAFT_330333 [Serendipita vermifera MAFF 305830]|uniref:Copper transport protein n=1 Tax=Serendipita vermifera MAFF 305830 TaxID=933852 RepID=A0A0C3B445_SERVB|nr:hypothetical protein M408DRAFT_330333 [Serendipita vermifera MAFF 305830]
MDHGHHHMDSEMTNARCSMYMLWNTNIIDTCVVFRQWHIHNNFQFILSFLAIVALGCSYEWLRDLQRRYDRKVAIELINSGKGKNAVSQNTGAIVLQADEDELIPLVSKATQGIPVPLTARVTRAVLYGASVFVSFFLMLVFMTYNAYLILATVIGAVMGHYLYGAQMDPDAVLGGGITSKGMSCH